MSRKKLFGGSVRDPLPLVKSLLDDTAPVLDRTSNFFSGAVIHPTASWRFDPPGAGIRSTQQLHIDYSKFENHVFFNSAQAKVNMAFDEMINRFPFDGTKKELQIFLDGLGGYERYLANNFPSYVGSLAFDGQQYINVWDRAGSFFPSLAGENKGTAVLDPLKSSFSFDFQIFLPKNATPTNAMPVCQKINDDETVGITIGLLSSGQFFDPYDPSNPGHSSHAPSGSIYLLVSDGLASVSGSMLIEKGKFEHVAINVVRQEDDAKIEMYRNGFLISTSSNRNLGTITTDGGAFFIGRGSKHKADILASEIDFAGQKFVGSLDEFRFFHKERSRDEIVKNSTANISKQSFLKLYYRFNEPTGSYTNNNVILDSSGNSLHSKVETYIDACRGSRGSALPEEDPRMSPVLFPSHPDLIEHNKKLLFSASYYDASNPNLITRLIPSHYLRDAQQFEGLEAEDGGVGDPYGTSAHIPKSGKISQPQLISGLLFVWASFFDEMKLFIESLGSVEYVSLVKSGSIPDQFLIDKAERLGFPLPDMYSNAGLAQFLFGVGTQKDPGIIDKSLNDVQNEVWRRVLSDLNEIMASKGTVHSIEAFLRDVGIEPNGLFRLREYGGSRKIYLGRERVKRKEVTPFLEFTSSYNDFNKVYDTLDGLSTNYPVLRSPFLVASRSEPGNPGLSSFHNLGEYYVGRGYQYRKAESLVSHFRYTSGSGDPSLVFTDITNFSSTNTGAGFGSGLSLGPHVPYGYITGTISPVYGLQYGGLGFSVSGNPVFSTIGDDNSLSFGDNAFTIMLWVQFPSGHPSNDSTERCLFEKQTEYQLTFNAAGNLVFKLMDDAADQNISVVGVTPAHHDLFDGKWHMITCAYLGNESANSLKIYIDDYLLVEGLSETGTYEAMSNGGSAIKIGGHSSLGGVTGNYSDFAVWSAALDSIDVKGVYYSYAREENKKVNGPDLPYGMLTSGSWTYEGWYKFRSHYLEGKPERMPKNQSLVRFMVTGSTAPSSKGGLIGNLVMTSGSNDAGSSLTLFMKPNLEGSVMSMTLTGANYFNGQPWHISVGRSRNDMTGSQKFSSYFLRAGTVSDGKLSYYTSNAFAYEDETDYNERQKQKTSMFTSGSKEFNRDGVFFVIGESKIDNVEVGGKFLHAADAQASTTLTISNGTADCGMSEREFITLTSYDTFRLEEESIRYVIINSASSNLQTGDIIEPGDDYGSSTFSANSPEVLNKSVAIALNLSGGGSTQNDFLVQLKNAINSYHGHNDAVNDSKITVGRVPAAAGGNQTLVLTQTPEGSGGNTLVTSIVTNLTAPNFSGGTGSGSIKSTGNIYVDDGDALHGMTAGQKITIKDTEQNIIDYFISDTSNGDAGTGHVAHLGAVANGATLASGVTASRTVGSSKGIAVGFNLGASLPGGTSQSEFLGLLRAAIIHANGHNGKIMVGDAPSEVHGLQTLEIKQLVGGELGNNEITSNVTNVSVDGFSGGLGVSLSRVTDFKGQLGPVRFYSKEVKESETKQHIMNFRSIGVENPHVNFNFNVKRSGSFERLRLDAHIDQETIKTDGNGKIDLFDFSNNLNHLKVQGLEKTITPFEYFTMDYSIFSPYIDRSVTNTKIRVRSFKDRTNVKQYEYSEFAPVYDVNPYEENLDDNRFSVEVSAVQGINEDIMNILGSMDSIEDAIASPNLAFASSYHDLTSLRETYFKRLTGKVHYKEFFEFFKWFDRSIGKFIDFLLPSKTNFLGTNFIIESHFLERHKMRYNFKDMYLGESDRDGLKGEIKLQLITGSITRI